MAGHQRNLDTAREFIEAFNTHDWKRVSAGMAPDAVYDELGTGRKAEGRDDIVDLLQGWVEAMPDAAGTVTRVIDADNTVVLEVIWKGTMTGSLGEIPATGRSQTTPAMLVFEFDDGQIKECRQFFDSLALFDQLGLMPAPARA